MINKLTLREKISPYGDITKNSVLSISELDNNQIFLKGEVIYTAQTIGDSISFNKINGDTISVIIPTSSGSSGTDTYVTGGTYNNGVSIFTNNTGGTFSVSGYFTGATSSGGDTYWTSGSTGLFSVKANNDSLLDATNDYSLAEGYFTIASGYASHSEGNTTTSIGGSSHSEGGYTLAIGENSHAEGSGTIASGDTSHAQGFNTIASGGFSHSEGENTTASGYASHAQGQGTIAIGAMSYAEGIGSIASGETSHAEGYVTEANGLNSHSEGIATKANGVGSHAQGNLTIANGSNSHTEGYATITNNTNSHAGGENTIANGYNSFVHGSNSQANGLNTIVLGANITGNTANTVYVDSLNLNTGTTATATAQVGTFVWNDVDGTADLKLKGGNVTLQVGQETVVRVLNKTATNITLEEANYQVVKVTGAQGQKVKIDLAQANSSINAQTSLGVVTETILNNEEGFICTTGQIHNINTTGSLQGETWSDGDIVYLSPTVAGQLTKVKPVAPNQLVKIGIIEHSHITQGKLFVKIQNSFEIGELNNVLISGVTGNQILSFDSGLSVWKNTTPSISLSGSVSGILLPEYGGTGINNSGNTLTIPTSMTAVGRTTAGSSTRIPFYTNANELNNSANLTYNAVVITQSNTIGSNTLQYAQYNTGGSELRFGQSTTNYGSFSYQGSIAYLQTYANLTPIVFQGSNIRLEKFTRINGTTTALSSLDVTGSFGSTFRSTTGTTTLDATDYILDCNNAGSNIIVNLPPTSVINRRYLIIRGIGSTGSITITPPIGTNIETLAGTLATTHVLSASGAVGSRVEVIYNGAEYRIINT